MNGGLSRAARPIHQLPLCRAIASGTLFFLLTKKKWGGGETKEEKEKKKEEGVLNTTKRSAGPRPEAGPAASWMKSLSRQLWPRHERWDAEGDIRISAAGSRGAGAGPRNQPRPGICGTRAAGCSSPGLPATSASEPPPASSQISRARARPSKSSVSSWEAFLGEFIKSAWICKTLGFSSRVPVWKNCDDVIIWVFKLEMLRVSSL